MGDYSLPPVQWVAHEETQNLSRGSVSSASFINLLSSLGYPGAYTSSKISSNHDKEAHQGSYSVSYSLILSLRTE